MSETRELLVRGAIVWAVGLALTTVAWLSGVVSGAFLFHLLATIALAAPFVLLGIGLFASLNEKTVAVRFVGHRRIWLGIAALALIAAPTYFVAADAGVAHQAAFLPGLGVIAILALFCIGFGITELLDFDPLELFRMHVVIVVQRFITALNDRDKSAAMELVRPVPLYDPLSASYYSLDVSLKRHAAEETRSCIEQSIDSAIKGRPNLTAGPVEDGYRVQIRGDIGGVPLSEDAHLELTQVGDDYCISSVEL